MITFLFCWPPITLLPKAHAFHQMFIVFVICWPSIIFGQNRLLLIKLWRTGGGGDLASKPPAWWLTKSEFLEHIKTNHRLAGSIPVLGKFRTYCMVKNYHPNIKQDEETSKSAIRLRNIFLFFLKVIFVFFYALASIKYAELIIWFLDGICVFLYEGELWWVRKALLLSLDFYKSLEQGLNLSRS